MTNTEEENTPKTDGKKTRSEKLSIVGGILPVPPSPLLQIAFPILSACLIIFIIFSGINYSRKKSELSLIKKTKESLALENIFQAREDTFKVLSLQNIENPQIIESFEKIFKILPLLKSNDTSQLLHEIDSFYLTSLSNRGGLRIIKKISSDIELLKTFIHQQQKGISSTPKKADAIIKKISNIYSEMNTRAKELENIFSTEPSPDSFIIFNSDETYSFSERALYRNGILAYLPVLKKIPDNIVDLITLSEILKKNNLIIKLNTNNIHQKFNKIISENKKVFFNSSKELKNLKQSLQLLRKKGAISPPPFATTKKAKLKFKEVCCTLFAK